MPAAETARRPCAECRRLKIRCDREVPCGNCVKRGLTKICPDGKLTYGGGRFVLAGTAELHSKIQELSVRVRKLEAALEIAYAATTADTHPLLREEARIDVSSVEASLDPAELDPEESEMTNSFSMLAIEGDVRTSRLTPSHYSLWYLDNQENTPRAVAHPHFAETMIDTPFGQEKKSSPFPIELLRLAQGPYEGEKALEERLKACLPPIEVARSLVERYYNVTGAAHNLVPRALLEEEYWSFAYGCHKIDNISSLAVIYGIFCLGALQHPMLPAGALSAQQYNQLAMLAMSQDPLSITHIEALLLYIVYLCTTDTTHSKAWAAIGITIKLAQTLGIDRECRTWKVAEKDLIRRRRVFNELHSFDCYLSLLVGRCNLLSRGQHNSPLPQPAANLSPMEKAYAWKYLFLGEGVQTLLSMVLSTHTAPGYDATLSLDKKLRAYDAILDPQYLKELGTPPVADTMQSRTIRLQQQFIFLVRETTLLHLHRSFLNRAIMNPNGDPILSKWSISVMAAYQSACAVIRQARLMRDHQPSFLQILAWHNSVLTAVITLGALVIRTPFSSLSSVAYQELQSGCDLLKQHFPPGYFLFPVLDKLRAASKVAFENRDKHPLKKSVFILPEVRRPTDDLPILPNASMEGVSPTSSNEYANGSRAASENTPPVASQEALGAIFDSQAFDASILGTAYPVSADRGGMNWHFLPPPGLGDPMPPVNDSSGSGSNSDSPIDFARNEQAGWADFLKEMGIVQ